MHERGGVSPPGMEGTEMEPIKKIRNRWYYSDNVYINVNSGYYELCKNRRFIRSYSSLYDAIEGAKFLVRTDW